MPTPGLSLVGYMQQQQQAVAYLRHSCLQAGGSDEALVATWRTAAARLGPPFPRAGRPDLQPIPAAQQPYLQDLMAQPWAAAAMAGWPGASIQLVEIDPLLTPQFHLDLARVERHCGALPRPPSIDDLLPVGLPLTPPKEQVATSTVFPHSQSVIIKTPNTGLQIRQAGILDTSAAGQRYHLAGILFSFATPLAQVVRLNGKAYLLNGLHRAFGVRMAGATHLPCVVRDVSNEAATGIKPDGTTFDAALLGSGNPPTVGHFTQGRAFEVQIRAVSRILHVGWAEYTLPEE